MKKITLLAFSLAMAGFGADAQENLAEKYAETITQEDLKDNLTILASDALEGRETGSRGQKMAAAFISAHYESIGLQPGNNGKWQQPVILENVKQGDAFISNDDKKWNNYENVIIYSNANMSEPLNVKTEFVGNGGEEELKATDIQGKAVVVMNKDNRSAIPYARQIIEQGASTAIIVSSASDEDFNKYLNQFKYYMSNGRMQLPSDKDTKDFTIVFVSKTAAAELLGTKVEKMEKAAADAAEGKVSKLKSVKSKEVTFQNKMDIDEVKSSNVLAFIEGTDKKDELVIITSHYDHIGKASEGEGDLINNGADDDGSGTVSVMEIAEAFAMAQKDGNGPRRSILFMNVTGEEKGLLGSDYYTQHPVYPLESTVVNLNIDMVGRVDPEHESDKNYVYLVGSDKLSSELHEISEKTNEKYIGYKLDYTYNDPEHPDRIYYRSDHWNFAKNNIPVIFYFNGVHADYHKPSDEVDKIEWQQLQDRAKLVFYTAWELANKDSRIVVDKGQNQ
ncbi:M28 family peptidase [Marinigracilibium pacificum]|uniref:M28 family peptidase n=1 Tax=Marinigracilibium pacificum TaxID=2729599 RepID=A0A848IXC8_9BACT|nr:M28 family peptidase [Marinigracilibium pacificum]NMM46904.1 M28 family peptidase [Marinigracilibium pacificum]